MSQVLLHRFHAVALLQSRHGVCVPQIMETGVRSADPFHHRLEMLQRGLGRDITPIRADEHKIPFVFPREPRHKVLTFLLGEDLFQNPHNIRGSGNSPRFIVFGGCYVMAAAFFLFSLQLLPHGNRASTEAHRIP